MEVGHDDRLDATTGQCGDSGKADGPCPNDDRHFTGLHIGGAHIELADREAIDDGDGVAGYVALHDPRCRLGDDQ